MAPVVFSDIGKAASDLLGKDFPVGSIKLETKTTASNGVVRSITLPVLFLSSWYQIYASDQLKHCKFEPELPAIWVPTASFGVGMLW
jgi:hypothetical protein